jgi:uncharacterized protein
VEVKLDASEKLFGKSSWCGLPLECELAGIGVSIQRSEPTEAGVCFPKSQSGGILSVTGGHLGLTRRSRIGMTALKNWRGGSGRLRPAATLLAAALLTSCGKSPQQAFQDGMEAYGKGDYKTAMENWKPVAERGDASAETNVGLLYSQGKGVKQDYTQALDWYKKAAMQNYPDAEYNLGILYRDGKGVAADAKEALRWFTYAANSGQVPAQMKLAEMYMKGNGVDVNTREAVKWYEIAANKGDPQAQVQLGDMYAKGNGVPEDRVHAYVWYSAAVMQEEDQMVRARASIGRMRVMNDMDEIEQAEAERQAEEWREVKRTEANQ